MPSTVSRFLGLTRSDTEAAFCVAGIPFDQGVTERPGARSGPDALRRASRLLVDGQNPVGWVDVFGLDLADVGDFDTVDDDIPASLEHIEAQAAPLGHLVALGGDHTVTLALLRARARRGDGPLGLIHFDAHLDTWPDTNGQPYGHASVFRRAIEEGLVDPHRTVQIGIRSPVPREVDAWTREQGVRILTAQAVHRSTPESVAERIKEVVGMAPAYLSFDIDALDPGQAPGTGTPEVGGLFTWQAMAILAGLGGVDFVGMDVVEVCPAFDHAEITALAGASLAWQYLCLQVPE